MSVLVTMRVAGDVEQFRGWVKDEARLREIAERARSAGCLHHRFGVGEGFVVVVDEWESAAQFQEFISGMGETMRDAGARGEPEITITDAIATADQF
jgi:hypothetical protein